MTNKRTSPNHSRTPSYAKSRLTVLRVLPQGMAKRAYLAYEQRDSRTERKKRNVLPCSMRRPGFRIVYRSTGTANGSAWPSWWERLGRHSAFFGCEPGRFQPNVILLHSDILVSLLQFHLFENH